MTKKADNVKEALSPRFCFIHAQARFATFSSAVLQEGNQAEFMMVFPNVKVEQIADSESQSKRESKFAQNENRTRIFFHFGGTFLTIDIFNHFNLEVSLFKAIFSKVMHL